MSVHDADLVASVREFTRFYTRTVGLLDEKLNHSPFTLTEARVLFEIGQRGEAVASDIARDLGMDAAYLARLLKKFAAAGLVRSRRSEDDGRRRDLALTGVGREAFDFLQAQANAEIGTLLSPVPAADKARLGQAMRTIEQVLDGKASGAGPRVELRPHRPGDIGWVIGREAALYAGEYGWDITFEALVAEICANFIRDFRVDRDYCWIAELDGEPVGAIFLVYQSDDVAKLRLLHVEASARGLGIGKTLVAACIEKAREYGYNRLVLWTNDVLTAARGIYQKAGFRLVEEEKHHSFGKDLVGQNWELEL